MIWSFAISLWKAESFLWQHKIYEFHQQNSTDWSCWHLIYVNCQEFQATYPHHLFWRQSTVSPVSQIQHSLDQLLLTISGMNQGSPYIDFTTWGDHNCCNALFQTCSRKQKNKVQEKRSAFKSSLFQWLAGDALAKSLDFSASSSLCKQGEVILSHY